MSNLAKQISLELKQRHKVDEYFYSEFSMDIDLPNGLIGEVNEICKLLEKTAFKVTAENVFHVMELKESLNKRYSETADGKKAIAEYRKMILEEIKPVGATIPIKLLLANGIIVLLLSLAGRFLWSFLGEAGKITAKKLLDDEKKLSKEHNMIIKEYKFLRNQTVILIEKGNGLDFLIKNLQREEQNR